MEEKVLSILHESHPELDYTEKGVNFIDEGMLDSFDIVTLISEFEEQFDIQIAGADVLPENFANVDSIVKLIERSK